MGVIRLFLAVLAASAVIVLADHAAGTNWSIPIGVFACVWAVWLMFGEEVH